MHKPYLSGCLNDCRIFYYWTCNRTFRRETIDISFLFKQRNTQIPILSVSPRTFSRPTVPAWA